VSVLQLLGTGTWGCSVRMPDTVTGVPRVRMWSIKAGETLSVPDEVLPYVHAAIADGNLNLLLGDTPLPLRQRTPTGHFKEDLHGRRDGSWEVAIDDEDVADLVADEAARDAAPPADYPCGLCEATFPSRPAMLRHREMNHANALASS